MNEQMAIQHLLRANLIELQSKNPKYSLRSFSKKLDVHVGALSAIMNGKRKVSKELAERIARRLLLDPQRRSEILGLFPEKKKSIKNLDSNARNENPESQEIPPSRYLEIESSQFRFIAEWEHYAVLSLMNCKDFQDDMSWISNRLGITMNRVQEVLARLLDLKLIKRNAEDRLVRTHSNIRSSDDTANLSLRKSHDVTLDLAKESLHRNSVSERDFTYVTMAIDPKKLSVAKEMIRKFQDELSDELETGNRTEVYRLSMQLFPLTKLDNSKQG